MADALVIKPNSNFLLGYMQNAFTHLFAFLAEQKFSHRMELLRKKIQTKYINNTDIKQFILKQETVVSLEKYEDISFYVKMIVSSKPDKPKEKELNPFDKKLCKDKYIAELSSTHALIYNKYPMVPLHILIITKEFESQMSSLTAADFRSALEVMSSMNYFIFFNSGPNAGASQKHKHLQAILHNSFPGDLPLSMLVKKSKSKGDFLNNVQYTRVEAFRFAHVLCKFDNLILGLSDENVEERSKQLETMYIECQRRLANSKLNIAYNMILTKEWMFIVLRKCEVALNLIKVNALGFAGSFAVRSEVEYEFVLNTNPIEILNSITFPI
jgi:ATP adenylyltransferase